MLPVAVDGHDAADIGHLVEHIAERVLQAAALALVDLVPQNVALRESGGVLERSLMRRVAAVVYYNNMLKAFGEQAVDDAAELLIRVKRGQNYRQFLPDIVFFIQCDYLLVGELEYQ